MKQVTSRIQSLLLIVKTKAAPIVANAKPLIQKAVTLILENPHIIRAIAVLPLLISWFIGLHREEHRSAAYRGFLLAGLFLISSWVLYWIIDILRSYLSDGFFMQLLAFTLQGGLSLVYIGYSVRLAIAEYQRKATADQPLDRLKDRLLESI